MDATKLHYFVDSTTQFDVSPSFFQRIIKLWDIKVNRPTPICHRKWKRKKNTLTESHMNEDDSFTHFFMNSQVAHQKTYFFILWTNLHILLFLFFDSSHYQLVSHSDRCYFIYSSFPELLTQFPLVKIFWRVFLSFSFTYSQDSSNMISTRKHLPLSALLHFCQKFLSFFLFWR